MTESGLLSQDDIDALLRGGGMPRRSSRPPLPRMTVCCPRTTSTRCCAGGPSAEQVKLSAAQPPSPAVSPNVADDSSLLSQDEIDALLGGGSSGATPQASAAERRPASKPSSDSGLLSQDEIDALLRGLAEGSDGSAVEERRDEEPVRLYDFSSPDLGIRGFVFTLEMVNERFARLFRISLFNLLRRYGEISLYGIQVLKFGEYAHSLSAPISVNLYRVKPIGGTALLIFDPQLVLTVVDVFFGGGRFRTKLEKREFTAAESRVIHMMVDRGLKDLKEAWAPVMPLEFEFMSSEINPHYASVISSGEMVVVAIFHIDLEGIGGELHVTFPYSMLEPLREQLTAPIQSKGLESDARFLNALRDGIKGAEVEVSCVLAEAEITLGDLIRLKPGDVIPIEVPEKVTLLAEQVPIYWGRYGVAQGSWAVKVTDQMMKSQQLTSN